MERSDVNRPASMLRYSLLAGACYFACIAAAHLASIKIPGLYIYYNVQSYSYQDNIISFLSLGWALFYLAASRSREVVPYVLVASVFALLGLVNINLSIDFEGLGDGISLAPFWWQTGALFVYVSCLVVCYVGSGTEGFRVLRR